MVTSFAAVTNLPTVISFSLPLPAAPLETPISFWWEVEHSPASYPCRSQASGSGMSLSCVRRCPIDSKCFSAAATLFFSLIGHLALLVKSIPRNHRLAVRWLIIGWLSLISGLNFNCRARFDISSKRTSSKQRGCLPTNIVLSRHETRPPMPLPTTT